MTTNQPDRLDRIEAAIENLTSAVTSAIVASNARMDRLEALVETSYEPVQALLQVSTENQLMISRLDAILERPVYREGRGNDEQQ